MVKPNLKTLLKRWQYPLGLAHWVITATYAEAREMDEPYNLGDVSWSTLRRSAEIKILKPSAATDIKDYDVEKILIHELVHLVLAAVLYDEGRERALEQTIDDLVSALHQNSPYRD